MNLLDARQYLARIFRYFPLSEENTLFCVYTVYFLSNWHSESHSDREALISSLRNEYPQNEENLSSRIELLSRIDPDIRDILYEFMEIYRGMKIVGKNRLYNLLGHILEFVRINENIPNEQFIQLFSFLSRNNYGSYIINEDLSDLLGILASYSCPESIYDPFCRIGNILVSCHKKSSSNPRLIGQEQTERAYLMAKMNFLLEGLDVTSLSQSNALSLEYRSNSNNYEKFGAAVSVIPFGGRLDRVEKYEIAQRLQLPVVDQETAYLAHMYETLRDNGRLFTVIPQSFLVKPSLERFREFCINIGCLEAVINLPAGTLQSANINVSILILNKGGLHQKAHFINYIDNETGLDSDASEIIGQVYFSLGSSDLAGFNLSERVSYESIPYAEIENQSYSWNPEIYTHESYREIKAIAENSGGELIKLSRLISSSVSGRAIDYVQLVENESYTGLPYIQIGDLHRDSENILIDLSKTRKEIRQHHDNSKLKVLEEDAILVSLLGSNLKATLFKYSDQPIVLGNKVVALIPKVIDDLEYLFYQLKTRFTEIQHEFARIGTYQQYIPKKSLLEIVVPYPSEQEQRRRLTIEAESRFKERVERISSDKRQEEKLAERGEDIVAIIAHNYNQKLGGIQNDLSSLIAFLKNKITNGTSISAEELSAPVLLGENNAADIPTVEELLDRLQGNISQAASTFKSTLKILRYNEPDLEEAELKPILNQLKQEAQGKNYKITIRGEDRTVFLDKRAIKDALRNLIENAEKHGFVDNEQHYKILFEIDTFKDSETDESKIRIRYLNDGKSFAKDFDFKSYTDFGGRAGKGKGTGLGGFYVDKVIRVHHGRFSMLTNPSELGKYSVGFEIILPTNLKIQTT